MSVVQHLELYCAAFTLQKLTWERSDSLGPKLGARAFMGLFAWTRNNMAESEEDFQRD